MTAPNNRGLTLSPQDLEHYGRFVRTLSGPVTSSGLRNLTINQDLLQIADWLPDSFVDLLILDPPYNLTKDFNSLSFRSRALTEYADWIDSWLSKLVHVLKPTASVYICSDWRSSSAVHLIAGRYLHVRNRITWEREKGRGAKANWKNCSEDIWFCTASDMYTFNLDSVKVMRRVRAPYVDAGGRPKDWQQTPAGGIRQTHPSNIWTDLTVPFWSMPENTSHPTQKPEKLVAKLILASSQPGDLVFDPFLGSGTTSVVAKKLGRDYAGVEADMEYCCLTEKRLSLAECGSPIQGYEAGVFWERNSGPASRSTRPRSSEASLQMSFTD